MKSLLVIFYCYCFIHMASFYFVLVLSVVSHPDWVNPDVSRIEINKCHNRT